jgi:hypothetical protein
VSELAVNVLDAVDELIRAGVRFSDHGGRLRVDAPPGVVTPELGDLLFAGKAVVLEWLARRQPPPPVWDRAEAFRLLDATDAGLERLLPPLLRSLPALLALTDRAPEALRVKDLVALRAACDEALALARRIGTPPA